MALKVLHAGDGYTYLLRQVATGDTPRQGRDPLAAYYHAEGNPPGEWIGSGIIALGVHGEVREDQMQALYGERLHPEANALIATAVAQGANITNALVDVRLGRRLAQYDNDIPLIAELQAAYKRFEQAHRRRPDIQERRDIKEQVAAALLSLRDPYRVWADTEVRTYITDELGRARQPVSGFDLVFSQPTKSADILWALGDHRTRTALEQAHHDAVRTAMTYLEHEAAFSRAGKAGIAQIDTAGLVATAFTHRESRAGDPNLHTHVAVANVALCGDGRWRTLDSRQLHHAAVSASEVYNAAWERGVTNRLNVRWTTTPRGPGKRPVRDIAGIPQEWVVGFSQRRTQVEAIYDQLVARYVRAHGATPSRSIQLKLAQQAATTDRPDKAGLRSLRDQLADWTRRARDLRPDLDIPGVVRAAVTAAPSTPPDRVDVPTLSAAVIHAVSERRATWTVYHVRAEAERVLRGLRTGPEHEHTALREAVVGRALDHDSVKLDITPDPPPAMLRRADGESVLRRRGFARYTSNAILGAEQRLVQAARIRHGPAVADGVVDKVLTHLDRKAKGRSRITLNPGQRDLVRSFVSSGRALTVAIGPPGTGKSTAMRAVAEVWRTTGGRVIGLAPSAAAASVLGDMLGIPADTIHSLVTARLHHQPVDIRQGDMLLVDEAGMAGTLMLDHIRSLAAQRGAVVRLVGDYRQLAAVEAGGVLRLIHTQTGGVELTEVHRFRDPTEAQAVLQVRVGDRRAVSWYAKHDRLHGGPQAALLDKLYTAWRIDRDNDHAAIMSSDTNDIVAELSARAQTELRATGHVDPTGIPLRDGNHAGRGDTIVTRLNRRDLRPRLTDHVKNGDLWTVQRVNPDGSLKARHLKHKGTVTLPAHYVTHFVELGYAATIHRTQGINVDIAHAHLSPHATRQLATVALSRGTDQNHLYLDTTAVLAPDEPPVLPGDLFYRHRETRPVVAAFAALLTNDGTEKTATETQQDARELPYRLDHQVPEYEHALLLYHGTDPETQAEQWVEDALPQLADTILADDAWPSLQAVLHEIHDIGHDPTEILATNASSRELDTAQSIAKVLHHRLNEHLEELEPTPLRSPPASADPDKSFVPIWLPPPPVQPAHDVEHAELLHWLQNKHDSIARRVEELALNAIQRQPSWLVSLGPPQSLDRRLQWLDAVAQIAAFRERWSVPDTDPEILGPPACGTRERARRWLANTVDAHRHDSPQPTKPSTLPISDVGPAPVSANRLRADIHKAATTYLEHQAAQWLRQALPTETDPITADPAWPALAQLLHHVDDTGTNPVTALIDARAERETRTAKSLTKVLHHRLGALLPKQPTATRDPAAPKPLPTDAARAMRNRLTEIGRNTRHTESTAIPPPTPNPTALRPATNSHQPNVPTPGTDFFRDLAEASTAYLNHIAASTAREKPRPNTNALKTRAARLLARLRRGTASEKATEPHTQPAPYTQPRQKGPHLKP
ncbi:MobF family relaxase [Actinosynnema sp. NPDC023587]|uniref:MobF family relaxase n=1 Tax=Actinosynnema sp. NPDC023587 TaxID=3154695 RepID=UPI0034066CBD